MEKQTTFLHNLRYGPEMMKRETKKTLLGNGEVAFCQRLGSNQLQMVTELGNFCPHCEWV